MDALVLLMIAGVVAYFLGDYHQDVRSFLERRADQRRREQVVARLHRADQQIRDEARRARRDMNDAAKQNWRDLAG